MRTILVFLAYFSTTNSFPSKEALIGSHTGALEAHNEPLNGARTGVLEAHSEALTKALNGANKEVVNGSLQNVTKVSLKGAQDPANAGIVGSQKTMQLGDTSKQASNQSTKNLNSNSSSTKHIPTLGAASAPVQEEFDEALLPMHKGREHVFVQPPEKNVASTHFNKMDDTVPTKTNTTLPNQSHVVPKKGVSLTKSTTNPPVNNDKLSAKPLNASENVTVHKKPSLLESDGDDSKEPVSSDLSKEAPLSITQIDPTLLHSKPKRADYIIPIVGVIFSVPVVAILISVVYKRGSDWWRYRNYKRMDFLIEGMYQ